MARVGLLRNWPIAVKVLAAVSAALVALLVVGVAGILSLRAVNQHATTLYLHEVQPLAHLSDARDMQGDTRWEIRDYLLADGVFQRSAVAIKMHATDAQLDADIAFYIGQGGDLGSRRGLMLAFRDRLTDYRAVRDTQFMPAADAGKTALAQTLLNGVLQIADDAMGAPIDDLFVQEDTAAKAQAAAATQTYRRSARLLIALLVAGALSATFLGLLVASRVARPVRAVMSVLERVGRGDLTGHVDVNSRDEVGQMGRSLNAAIATLRATVTTLTRNAEAVARSSVDLTTVSAELSGSSKQVSARAELVAATAAQISSSTQTVAGGAEELGASIREIAQNASDAATVAVEAVASAGVANATMESLLSSSAEISDVVNLISSIAEQTKLLALNATIEAARAGSVGGGFAVVAAEVKQLAEETAQASHDVARRISSIQSNSRDAAEAIAVIGEVIARISSHTATIASAVEEQTATTAEIARSVSEAAGGSAGIADNISDVAAAAARAASAVDATQGASDELATLSTELAALVAQFTVA